MPVIDFTEIPPANTGEGNQDTFELFSRDFFSTLGFEIEESPSRGPDGGKDLLILENLSGTITETKQRWVVSCKHYSASKKSVGDKDEIDIIGRVRKYNANGFMAFYSTVPSSGLMGTISRINDEIGVAVWDNEKIESMLISDKSLQLVFERYFPKSFKKWKERDQTPTQVLDEYAPLNCVVCNKDLLPERSGNVVFVLKRREDDEPTQVILDVYWACRGRCDRVMDSKYKEATSWESIKDLSIPLVYVRWFIATFNNLYSQNRTFTDEAFEKFKDFTICMSQIVLKETTPEQWDRIRVLARIPSTIGGLG